MPLASLDWPEASHARSISKVQFSKRTMYRTENNPSGALPATYNPPRTTDREGADGGDVRRLVGYLPRRRRTPHPPTMLTLQRRPIHASQPSSSSHSLWRVCHPFELGVLRRHSLGRWRTPLDQRREGSMAPFRLPWVGVRPRVVPSLDANAAVVPRVLDSNYCCVRLAPLCLPITTSKGTKRGPCFHAWERTNETSTTRA